jgi:hypothetical protein
MPASVEQGMNRRPIVSFVVLAVGSLVLLVWARVRRVQDQITLRVRELYALDRLDAVCATEGRYDDARRVIDELAAGSHLTRLEAIEAVIWMIQADTIPATGWPELTATDLYQKLFPI